MTKKILHLHLGPDGAICKTPSTSNVANHRGQNPSRFDYGSLFLALAAAMSHVELSLCDTKRDRLYLPQSFTRAKTF
jgi:hypothetical protein